MSVHESVHVNAMPKKVREIGSPETAGRGHQKKDALSYPNRNGLNVGPLQKQFSPLTAEPFSEP